jgi:hypothetical protein
VPYKIALQPNASTHDDLWIRLSSVPNWAAIPFWDVERQQAPKSSYNCRASI